MERLIVPYVFSLSPLSKCETGRTKDPGISQIAIVGGGPAGLAAAIALVMKDFRVTVFDCAIHPIDKACGEGLLPGSQALLKRLGISLNAAAHHRFHGIRFTDGTTSVEASFPNGPGIGIRRTVLHELLVQRAQELGVALCWSAKSVRLLNDGLSVNGAPVKCDFVIAADGQNSAIRAQAGLQRAASESRRYGFRRHFRIAPWSQTVDVHWGPGSQFYITPVAPDEVGVALISSDPKLRIEAALLNFPELKERLHRAVPVSSERGALSVSRTLRAVSRQALALVGDASGSVDAITGEGLGLAFEESLALADALAAGDLPAYQRAHRAINRRPRMMAAVLLALDKRPGLQRRAFTALERHPDFFASLLAIHVGESPVSRLFSWQLLNLCRDFLAA